MANIKFSQFTVGNTESDIDFVVGYKGANNIQISPANLLSATLTGYLPLTGGTMSGNVKFSDNVELRLGSGADLKAYHSGTNTLFDNNAGDLFFRNFANDKDIVFQSDDGSGGVTTYMFLDGSTTLVQFFKSTKHSDNIVANFGNSNDAQIYHSGTNGFINNNTGNLYITNYSDNEDIIFRSDDGAGGVATYFYLDGSLTTTDPRTIFPDNSVLGFGAGADLQIYHDSTNSVIQNFTGNLTIQNTADDSDIVFRSDDGSGGLTDYFRVDGGAELNRFAKNVMWNDSVVAYFGGGFDLQIYHDGTNSVINNTTGNLQIYNNADNSDISFISDDGSGGTTEYFKLDGSAASGGYLYTNFPDQSTLSFGSSLDFNIFHFGNTFLNNETGDLYITNSADDKDVLFRCDDGAGGVTTYFQLDGGQTQTRVFKNIKFEDNVQGLFGTSDDLQIFHNGGDSFIDNYTGNLTIRNRADDSDIVFTCDDGSGGLATYVTIDGSTTQTKFEKNTKHLDSVEARFGASNDLVIKHDGTNSVIDNYTGDLIIQNQADDKDIVFKSDDGSGGTTTYFQLDGGSSRTLFSKNQWLTDNVKILLGNNDDLEIYHDGSDSIIKDGGTGSLDILSSHVHIKSSGGTNNMAQFFSGGNSYIYANNVLRIEATTSGAKVHGGLNITGVSEYADNTAAIAAGLTTGDVYRTGDLLKIVH